jgi:hypothetical protein
VAENVSPELESRIASSLLDFRRQGPRCQLSFRDTGDFDALLPQLLSGGARLVSVNPVKETLEDHFLREVAR